MNRLLGLAATVVYLSLALLTVTSRGLAGAAAGTLAVAFTVVVAVAEGSLMRGIHLNVVSALSTRRNLPQKRVFVWGGVFRGAICEGPPKFLRARTPLADLGGGWRT